MEIVFITKSRGTLARLSFGWSTLAVTMLLVGALGALGAYFGFAAGTRHMSGLVLQGTAESDAFWQREIVRQRRVINDIEGELDNSLAALAARVGRLQAHAARLDAVAGRVVGVAGLDETEFRMAEQPALGGPADELMAAPEWDGLLAEIGGLDNELAMRADHLTALETLLRERELVESMLPSGRPLNGGWISSSFGYRTSPVSGNKELHRGIDFAGRLGSDVKAVASGVVTWSGKRWGYGNLVEINHGNGYVTRYAHNKQNLVKLGDTVARDQTIALLGSTGRSTGPHVHFEVVRDGKLVNPWNYIKSAGTNP
ncbi:MAG: M23 family metallopeptidase [Gammaproteobacteria bacterium]|nr:M23 family metallopeptidase [Gammaproteobacteria bacterium]